MFDPFDENKTPKDKFFEIIFHANRNLVIEELEDVFKRLAALEILAEECYKDELEQKIQEISFTKSDELEEMENDLYIHSMSNILTKNE
jgi:predicted house-cleaning noncanonical NTP pyrophosphatase (MazG superfamily)